jgi:PKD repeat protein
MSPLGYRLLRITLVVILLLSHAVSKAGAADYYPLQVGNSWTYSPSYGDKGDRVDTIVGTETVNSTLTYIWDRQEAPDDNYNEKRWYAKEDSFLKCYRIWSNDGLDPALNITPPWKVFKLNTVAGDTWEFELDVGSIHYKATYYVRSTTDSITVDAGSFNNCIRVQELSEMTENGATEYEYEETIYAPDVGPIIYRDYTENWTNVTFSQELVSFSVYNLAADFTADVTSGPVPLTVNFTDQSSGDITSWSWDFGDGSTSTEQNPAHTYTDSGTYTVSLTVTGPEGTDTETKTDFIVARDASFSTAAAFAVLANMYSDSAMANAGNALDDPSYYPLAALYASSAYEYAEDAYEDATAALAAAASYTFWGYYAPVYAESDINVRDDAVDSIVLAAQYAALGDLETAEYYLGYGLSLAAAADFYNGPTIWCAAMESSGQAAAQQSSESSELEPSANGTSSFSSAATNAVLSNMYFATSVTYGVPTFDDPANIPLVQLYASTAYDYAEDAYNDASAALDGNSSFWGVYAAQYAESDMNNKADAVSAFDKAVLAYQSGDLETAYYYLGYGFSLACLADLYNATTIWCASMESEGGVK